MFLPVITIYQQLELIGYYHHKQPPIIVVIMDFPKIYEWWLQQPLINIYQPSMNLFLLNGPPSHHGVSRCNAATPWAPPSKHLGLLIFFEGRFNISNMSMESYRSLYIQLNAIHLHWMNSWIDWIYIPTDDYWTTHWIDWGQLKLPKSLKPTARYQFLWPIKWGLARRNTTASRGPELWDPAATFATFPFWNSQVGKVRRISGQC